MAAQTDSSSSAIYVYRSVIVPAALWIQIVDNFKGVTLMLGGDDSCSPTKFGSDVLYSKEGAHGVEAITRGRPAGLFGWSLRTFARVWNLQLRWSLARKMSHLELVNEIRTVIEGNPDTFDSGVGAALVLERLVASRTFEEVVEILRG